MRTLPRATEDLLSPSRRTATIVAARLLPVAFALLGACSDTGEIAATANSTTELPGIPRGTPVIDVPTAPYREAPVARGGSVRGAVEIDGEAPRDTTVQPTSDIGACGASLVDETLVRRGNRLGGVVVWLADVRTGKRIPLARRYEITHERCQLAPRAQSAAAGGTLNVRNADAAAHRARFIRHQTGQTLALVSEHDAGQVVPVEQVLTHPGLIEVRCDQHPWTHGWIAVFDHPYHAVSERDGTFALVDVPPGTYRLVGWHERLGRVEQSVTVEAGKEARVVVKMGGA